MNAKSKARTVNALYHCVKLIPFFLIPQPPNWVDSGGSREYGYRCETALWVI